MFCLPHFDERVWISYPMNFTIKHIDQINICTYLILRIINVSQLKIIRQIVNSCAFA